MLASLRAGELAPSTAPPLRCSPARDYAAVAALALGLAGLLLFSALAIARHQSFQSGRQDLEIYLQVLWNTTRGHPFATTLLKSNELHLAEHLALALLPLAPLYGLLPN